MPSVHSKRRGFRWCDKASTSLCLTARILTIPRHNPVNAFTLGGIVRDAGLSVEQFRELL